MSDKAPSAIGRKQIITWAAVIAMGIAVPMEGTFLEAYYDPVGLPTICMGSTHGVKIGDTRTLPECKALLTREMTNVVETVDRCRPGLPPQVLAAFADAAYNIGEHVACDAKRSTAARMLLLGDIAGACRQLLRWDRATVAGQSIQLSGLTKRRQMEMELCLS